VGCKIFTNEYLPEAMTDASLNKTFIETKTHVNPNNYYPIEKLSIPKFGGDPKEYIIFRNMFDKTVGEADISAIFKFSHLKSYLVGEPLSLIGNLMLTDSNYDLALTLLTARYSNRRVITGNHIEELYNAPKAFISDGSSIRKLLNIIVESIGAFPIYHTQWTNGIRLLGRKPALIYNLSSLIYCVAFTLPKYSPLHSTIPNNRCFI